MPKRNLKNNYETACNDYENCFKKAHGFSRGMN